MRYNQKRNRKGSRIVKKIMTIIASLIVLFTIIIFAAKAIIVRKNELSTICPDLSNCREDFDAIVAISGGNTNARTIFATNIFNNGIGKKMIFSGANSDARVLSDAEQMSILAQKNGVNKNNIITETEARNTEENAKFTAEIIKRNNFSKIILVTSPYHSMRAKLEFERALKKLGVRVVLAPASNDNDFGKFWWTSSRGWFLAVSEIIGIIRFYLGDINE